MTGNLPAAGGAPTQALVRSRAAFRNASGGCRSNWRDMTGTVPTSAVVKYGRRGQSATSPAGYHARTYRRRITVGSGAYWELRSVSVTSNSSVPTENGPTTSGQWRQFAS